MKICIRAHGQKIPATLEDNLTAQHFYRLLPMTLNMDDFGGKEKISDPPEPLTKEGAPEGALARAGDLMLFAPWGNLALFYRDHGYARGLIPIARMESHLDLFVSSGSVQVQFLKTEE